MLFNAGYCGLWTDHLKRQTRHNSIVVVVAVDNHDDDDVDGVQTVHKQRKGNGGIETKNVKFLSFF